MVTACRSQTSEPRMASAAPRRSAISGVVPTDSFSLSWMITGPLASGTECAKVAANTVRGSAEPSTKRPRRPCTEAVVTTSRFFSTVKARLTSSAAGALLHGRLTHDAHSTSAHIAIKCLFEYIPHPPRRTLHEGDP